MESTSLQNASSASNSSAINFTTVETTTVLNNLTTILANIVSGNDSNVFDGFANENSTLEQSVLPEDDDGAHKNPELKYFSTVIIICMGLTILIVPVFCFIGVVCARANVFKTLREAASRGWGFGDLTVPYSEFGAEDYTKSDIVSVPSHSTPTSNVNCDVKVLVAEDNRVSSGRSTRKSSFLRVQSDEDEDISTMPATFYRNPV